MLRFRTQYHGLTPISRGSHALAPGYIYYCYALLHTWGTEEKASQSSVGEKQVRYYLQTYGPQMSWNRAIEIDREEMISRLTTDFKDPNAEATVAKWESEVPAHDGRRYAQMTHENNFKFIVASIPIPSNTNRPLTTAERTFTLYGGGGEIDENARIALGEKIEALPKSGTIPDGSFTNFAYTDLHRAVTGDSDMRQYVGVTVSIFGKRVNILLNPSIFGI